MSDLTFVLPEQLQMKKALLAVSDTGAFRANLYPKLVERAGETVTPVKLALIFVSAINAYGKVCLDTHLSVVVRLTPRYVKALVGEGAFADETKRLLTQSLKNIAA